MDSHSEYPKFLMQIAGQKWYLCAAEAGKAYNSNFAEVEILDEVLEKNHRTRSITLQERQLITELAAQCNSNK